MEHLNHFWERDQFKHAEFLLVAQKRSPAVPMEQMSVNKASE